MRAPADRYFPAFHPYLPGVLPHSTTEWHEMMPIERHPLPEYVPDVAAGASAPRQLTPWKIAALKLAVLLDQTGYVTRQDFKRFGIDIRRWISGDWLRRDERGFTRGSGFPDLRTQHPKVWEQILIDEPKWARPDRRLPMLAPAEMAPPGATPRLT
jgi:hypothetical protein